MGEIRAMAYNPINTRGVAGTTLTGTVDGTPGGQKTTQAMALL